MMKNKTPQGGDTMKKMMAYIVLVDGTLYEYKQLEATDPEGIIKEAQEITAAWPERIVVFGFVK